MLQSGEQIYALVALCLQTKYVERLLLENRKAETILAALNVTFTIFGSPRRILADKEGGIMRMIGKLQEINDSIMAEHDVSIEVIPTELHCLAEAVERRIQILGKMLGTINMSESHITVASLCHTFRIIANHLNNLPHLIQFVGGQDKGAASGFNALSVG